MNGRIYDPTLGRFLQADPFIQAPKNSQNYNRYSYVLNNPMSYTDPSGYFFVSLFKGVRKFVKKYWKVIAAAAVSYFTFGATSGWAAGWALGSGFSASAAGFMGDMAGGAAAGFVSGAIMTGSLRGALKGAFVGAATAGIFEGVAQYGFNTSTVSEAATAMQLEQAGISRETIAKLYSNGKTPRLSGEGELIGEISDESLLGKAPENSTAEFNKGFEKFKTTSQYRSNHYVEYKDTYAIGSRDASGNLLSSQEFKTFEEANKYAALKVDNIDKVWLRGINVQYGVNNYSYLYKPSTYSYNHLNTTLTHTESVMRVLSHETSHFLGYSHSMSMSVREKIIIQCARGAGPC